jgi:Dockerin type I domain
LADDNAIGPFSIGFDFPFYDTSYSQFWIGSNGLIGFGSSANIASLLNTLIPKDSLPNNFIAWCWDDLNIQDPDNPGGRVLMQNVDGNLVIEFKAYPEYDLEVNPGDVITAEVILSPSGKIKIQYQHIAPGFDHVGCTVGIENRTGLIGLPVVVNAAYLKDELAIQFKHPDDTWLSASPMGGIVNPGSKDTIDVLFDATDCPNSAYEGLLTLISNAPANPTINVPITMTVGGAMYGDADNNGAINISDAVYIIAYIFSGGQSPDPIVAGDANCDGACNISDAVHLIAYIFSGGPAPCTK